MDINLILENKLISIVRGLSGETLINTAKAIYDGGIRLLEVTFDQSGAIDNKTTAEDISSLVSLFGDKMAIGAGTVLTEEQVTLAHSAGAQFIISPDTNEKVIKLTKKLGMISIPGALTPTEVRTAHDFGADFVKIFPCVSLGADYIKAVRAPLSHIKLLAVGGVTPDNMETFAAAGACGFGIATAIADVSAAKRGDFEKIKENALRFTERI